MLGPRELIASYLSLETKLEKSLPRTMMQNVGERRSLEESLCWLSRIYLNMAALIYVEG